MRWFKERWDEHKLRAEMAKRDETIRTYRGKLETLFAKVRKLETQAKQSESTIEIQELTIKQLMEVIERDRKRVEAETAIEAKRIVANDRRT